jgi:hypothetical protein
MREQFPLARSERIETIRRRLEKPHLHPVHRASIPDR